ncbi:ISAs1 family transposase (plasmid) [Acaryochloris marina S15]|nr:ISAs1 family transposase [Acaryochloris marina]QUY45662.1 ISAs1 family transposase [Acaryochloris marina S15]QUY45679.1 ISAs1 family transposase [Acaryochloris marina S15]
MIDSGNNYLGALKGNQSGLLKGVEAEFKAQQTIKQINKGHGRIEKRTISISHDLAGIPAFPGLQSIIRIVSERQIYRANIVESSTETRYYVASFVEPVQVLADRIRGYWGVENKVHHVRDVTQAQRLAGFSLDNLKSLFKMT